MLPDTPEHYVDADIAAKFLTLKRRHILELARAGIIPAYPIGTGAHRTWRFRLSEIASAIEKIEAPASRDRHIGTGDRRRS